MKLPPLMDADDWVILFKGSVYCALAGVALVCFAAIVAVAWLVFRAVGSL